MVRGPYPPLVLPSWTHSQGAIDSTHMTIGCSRTQDPTQERVWDCSEVRKGPLVYYGSGEGLMEI